MIRDAAVQGRFYPSGKKSILKGIKQLEERAMFPLPPINEKDIIGAILPHAGHIYSGHETVPLFKYLNVKQVLPDTIVILHPNHSGFGPTIAMDDNLHWKNDVGEMSIDSELASQLDYPRDRSAHENEHSAEVLIPFIQHYLPYDDLMILPLCLQHINGEMARKLAGDIYAGANFLSRNILVIASSDFSHFLSPEEGFKRDQKVLSMIDKKDIDGVVETVIENRISVCGYSPIMVLMAYAELVDPAYSSRIVARGHSGDVHPSNEVVDYISMLFEGKYDSE